MAHYDQMPKEVSKRGQPTRVGRYAASDPPRPKPRTERSDSSEYAVTCLFAALNTATGQVTDACYPRHRHQEFLKFLKKTAARLSRHQAARGLRQLRHPRPPKENRSGKDHR